MLGFSSRNSKTSPAPPTGWETAPDIAIIYRSELDYISRCVLDYPDIETGGNLFGYWNNAGQPVVLYALGPGENATHQLAFFIQDMGYFGTIYNELNHRFLLSHIGEWHSHHQLGLARPSGHDASTAYRTVQATHRRSLLLCIANWRNGRTTVNPYSFHQNMPTGYVDAQWHIVEQESPFRPVIDAAMGNLLRHPLTAEASHGSLRTLGQPEKQGPSLSLTDSHWLRQEGGIGLMRKMVSVVEKLTEGRKCSFQADQAEGIIRILPEGVDWSIDLASDFPQSSPILKLQGQPTDMQPAWTPLRGFDDALKAFTRWITEALSSQTNIQQP